VVEVQATRTHVKNGKVETETRYYLSSLVASAEQFERLVRRHWSIENRLHWVLDVVMGEDQSRKRAGHAAANYAVIRKFALNLLRAQPEPMSLKRRQNHCAFSDEYRHQCLGF
jgi:predicted transposase YbfD/YdcC